MARGLPLCGILVGILAVTLPMLASAAELPDAEKSERFVPIFDGRSLNGWQGATDHWAVEDGKLVYRWIMRARSSRDLPNLKLMTTKEYADFVLRFEFKLDQAADNGVAIRAPLEGDPAFVGMKIQVMLDPNRPSRGLDRFWAER